MDDQLPGKIAELFRERLHVEVASPDADLIESGLLDSLTLVGLLFQIEQEYKVTLSIEELDMNSFRTVRSIARLLAGQGVAAEPVPSPAVSTLAVSTGVVSGDEDSTAGVSAPEVSTVHGFRGGHTLVTGDSGATNTAPG
jgi:acyl carrier protein